MMWNRNLKNMKGKKCERYDTQPPFTNTATKKMMMQRPANELRAVQVQVGEKKNYLWRLVTPDHS